MRKTTDKIDDLARQAFLGEPGANASFASRLRMRVTAEKAAARTARVNRIRAGVIVAAAASVVLLLLLNIDWSRPQNGAAAVSQNKPASGAPSDSSSKVGGEHAANRESRPPASNTPDGDVEKPEPKPEEKPKQPEEKVEKPKPEERPKQPEGEVEKPRPEPENPDRKPEEKPKQPESEVEKPKPEEPDKTDVKPAERRQLATVSALDKYAKAKIRYAESEAWRELASDEKILSGAQISASANVDLTLLTGAHLRFDGEVDLAGDDKEMRVNVKKESLYADNISASQPLTITAGELRAELTDGAAVFEPGPLGFRISVLHGLVKTVHGEITPGVIGVLTKRAMTKRGQVARAAFAKLLKALPARKMLREDFDKEPAGGLYGGKLRDGFAVSQGGNDSVAFKFEPRHRVLPGETIRVRFRATKAKKLLIQMFNEQKNDNFGYDIASWKDGEWQTLEFNPKDMLDRESGKVRPQVGTEFVNFQFRIDGPKEALLEIDSFEIVRIEE